MLNFGRKKLVRATALVFAGAVIASGAIAGDTFSPQAYAGLIKTEPYKSKGLTPVDLKTVAGLESQVIAKDGTAQMQIVFNPKAANGLYYKQIAELLKEYLDKATGASFRIVTAVPEGKAIFVGPVALPELKSIMEKADKLPAEHYLIESFAGGIILAGNDHDRSIDGGKEISIYNYNAGTAGNMLFCSRGTLFAAVDFLERFIGIRWYMSGPLGICVPDLREAKLQMPPVAYEDGPVFSARYPSLSSDIDRAGSFQEKALWGYVFTRMGVMMPVVANHTDIYWNKYYVKDHPEYFALRADGTRMTGKGGPEWFSDLDTSQRCYTNEAGFQEHLKIIEKYLNSKADPDKFGGIDPMRVPNKTCIYWLPNDGFPGCACPECMKLTDKDAPTDRIHSRLLWSYAARLGKAIKERWPEKKLCVLAYSTAVFIPPDIKLPDNIIVSFCMQDVADCYMKEPKYRQANQERLDDIYNKTHNKVGMWIYYPSCPSYENKMSIPLFAPHVQVEFFKTNKDKIYGPFLCNATRESAGVNGQALYLYHKQLWNPDINVDAYLSEFFALMYGPSATQMRDYYQTTIDRWENTRWSYLPPPYQLSRTIPESMIWKETYPRDVRDQLQKTLQAALKAAPAGSIYYARVQYMIDATKLFFEQGKFADETIKPLMDCARFELPPQIDGDTAEWNGKVPVMLKGWKGEAVSEKTAIFTGYDSKNIYIAGRVCESQGMILPADKNNKDDIWKNDLIEIYLCPDQIGMAQAGMPKSEQYYQIAINANGTVAVYRKTFQQLKASPLDKLDFTYAVKPMEKGFQFELAIPYNSISSEIPVAGKSEWFANFYRNRPRGEDKGYQAWSPTMGKSFFETSTFGILRFPPATLFEMDFAKAAISIQDWTTIPIPKEASLCLKDGKPVINVKALPALTADATTFISIDKIPKLPLDKPVKVEWAFRYKGAGLKEVNLTVKSSYNQEHKRDVASKTLQIVPSGNNGLSDWQRGSVKVDSGKSKFNDISYWDLGLRFAPGADFAIEIDYIKVLPDDKP
ncbi:MAG: DUF4838 domain-containing protein [Victivallaceae bacterium]|jgi:hypothetical protein